MREIAFGVAFSIIVAASGLFIAALPVAGRPVASFFPADISAPEAIAAIDLAGGQILQFGDTPALAISVSDQSDYAASLYRSGAWLVVNATLARLCMNATARTGI